MHSDFRTAALARDIAEQEAQLLHLLTERLVSVRGEEVAALRSVVEAQSRGLAAIERGILQELERLREALG